MKTFFAFILSLIFLNLLEAELKNSGDMLITVTNVESDKGQIRAVLFQGADGFPDESNQAFKSISVPASEGRTTFTFEQIPYGEYAISLLHDENENGKMDSNIFGYPQEGYGVSNNNMGTFGMPEYEKARFQHDQTRETLLIHLRN